MRQRRILIANLSLAAALTMAGCAGPVVQDDEQAAAPPRENLAPMGYRNNLPPGPSFGGAGDGPSPRGYPEVQNPFTVDLSRLSPQQSLGRDLNLLRESERAQEMMLEEMRNLPEPQPESLRRQEQKLEDIRKQIHIYDIALRQQDAGTADNGDRYGNGYGSGNANIKGMGMADAMLGDMMAADGVQAMAAPKNFEFPPRSEVRLPGLKPPERQMYSIPAPTLVSPPAPASIATEFEEEKERVVYDPRRDGDFGAFGLQSGLMQSVPAEAVELPVLREDETLMERRVIVPAGSIPPSQKYVPSISNPKPFAGAPVGRPSFPPPARREPAPAEEPRPEPEMKPAQENRLARTGLVSLNETPQKSSWPIDSEAASRLMSPQTQAQAQEPSSLRPPAELRPRVTEVRTERPAPEKTPERVIRIELPEPPAKQNSRASTRKAAPADEVFVPDLIF